MDAVTIGRWLQKAQLATGLSQAQVAERLGIPIPAVSLIESRQWSVGNVGLTRLVRLYGQPVSVFLSESGK